MSGTTAQPTVEVWSDIGCPWATLALHTLRSRVAERDVTLQIVHRAFPLELFNGRGTPRVVIDTEVVAIAGVRPELGWSPWQAEASTYPVSTLPAMAAVQGLTVRDGWAAADALDAALRHAFYADHRCITVPGEILAVAEQTDGVDERTVAAVVREGDGVSQVWDDFEEASSPAVQGSPHLFWRGGQTHNPGVEYHWTSPPPRGVPRLEAYDDTWPDAIARDLGLVD